LLDHNLPRQLKPLFLGHEVYTAQQLGWDALKNGALLAIAEQERFTVMVTGDQNLSYQQNDLKRSNSVVVLTEINRRLLIGQEALILEAIARATPGSYELVHIPKESGKSQR
jgi:hypothetical protein